MHIHIREDDTGDAGAIEGVVHITTACKSRVPPEGKKKEHKNKTRSALHLEVLPSSG